MADPPAGTPAGLRPPWPGATEGAPPPPGRRPTRRRAGIAVGCALVAAVATGVAVLVTEPGSGAGWPPAVAPIVAQVTRLRGLSFDRIVPVTFLDPGRFAHAVASGDQPRSAADRANARRYEEELRSLGLVGGNVDLVNAQSGADSSDTTGQYDNRTRSIEIRGRSLGVEQKVTLAHELTHALQDQHFDLHKLEDRTSTSGQDAALTALVEGDAVRIEDAYVSGLSAGDQGAYFRMNSASTPSGQAGDQADPEIVEVTSSAPYVLGADMVEAIAAVGGNAAVDAAFRSPPRAELDFLQPVAYLRHQRAVPVGTPHLDPGERQDGAPDDFGAFSLYLTLSSRIDPRTALAAADGWGGDSQVQYLVGGRSCTRVDLAGRDTAATAAIAGALGSWQAAMPPGQATVTARAGRVELTACDPGRAATAGSRSLNDALDLADRRDGNIDLALDGGAASGQALCFGNTALSDQALLAAEDQADRSLGEPPAGVTRTIQAESERISRSCAGSST